LRWISASGNPAVPISAAIAPSTQDAQQTEIARLQRAGQEDDAAHPDQVGNHLRLQIEQHAARKRLPQAPLI
jgi:hypothetical protein